MSSLTKKVITVTTTLIVVATFFFAQTTTAYADDPYLDANIPTSGMTNKDIEYMNEHEIDWLTKQNKVFKEGHNLVISFQALIDLTVKRHGDAPDLDVALGTYDDAFHEAEAVQLEAATVIGKQWGFDAQGHVTNREAALSTVTAGRESLRNARLQLQVAIRHLRRSFNSWHSWLINHTPYIPSE